MKKIIENYLQKYNGMSIALKASLWYTICNILQKGIALIVVPIYTRTLPKAEYGRYTVFQSWCNILIVFATLNLYCGVYTKAIVDHKDDRDRYTSCMQSLSSIITAVLFAVYLTNVESINSFLGMSTKTVCFMFLYFLFYPALTFWTVRQRVEYKYKEMVFVTLAVSILTPVLSLILLFATNLQAEAVIWGFLFTQSIFGAYFYVRQFVKGKSFYIKEYWKYALKFNIPLIPHYLSLIVLGQSDRIMIESYCGEEKAAIYSLAYQVAMIMNIFINAVNNTLVPWTYECLKERTLDTVRKICKSLCLLMGVFTVCAILVGPEIVLIMGSNEYMEAIWIIPSVAISVFFTFCYGLFSTVEFYYGATKYVMVASVVGAISNVILNAVYIPKYGYIAAGYTTLFCYFLFMIMHYLFMKKVCKKETNGENVYDIGFMALSCILICLCGAGCLLLYNYLVARWIVIVLICAVLFAYRKKIILLLKNIKA